MITISNFQYGKTHGEIMLQGSTRVSHLEMELNHRDRQGLAPALESGVACWRFRRLGGKRLEYVVSTCIMVTQ
jgi:hypothetical protein